MKKIIIAIITVLVLTGCSSAAANLSNQENVYTIGNSTTTSQDIYEKLKNNYGVSTVINYIIDYIWQNTCDTDVDLLADFENTYTIYKMYYGDEFYTQMGYASLDGLKKDYVSNEKLQEIYKSYINESYDDLVSEYTPNKLSLVDFADEKTAQEALDKLLADENLTLADIATEYESTTFKGKETVYTNATGLTRELNDYLSSSEIGIVKEVVSGIDGKFYIVEVINPDITNYEDAVKEAFINVNEIIEDAIINYTTKYNLSYYDTDIVKAIKDNYPAFQDPDKITDNLNHNHSH
ncbi:MAG: hypothetical protein ACK5G7_02295 [Erysipelotrichaceae bacterium]